MIATDYSCHRNSNSIPIGFCASLECVTRKSRTSSSVENSTCPRPSRQKSRIRGNAHLSAEDIAGGKTCGVDQSGFVSIQSRIGMTRSKGWEYKEDETRVD